MTGSTGAKVMITVGVEGLAEMTVSTQDTAIAWSSGDVPVLGTPRLLALLEEATCDAIRGLLPQSHTSVGTGVEIKHRRSTPVGAHVVASARVIEVDGARIIFEVAADHRTASGDEVAGVAHGRITRSVVERATFGA